jgi:hypothetical protein
MTEPWTWIAALVAVVLMKPFTRRLIAFLFAGRIGRRVLAGQPDRIHLEPADERIWRTASNWRTPMEGLQPLGFELAGHFTVREMPGLHLCLLAHRAGSFYAAIYEHPVAAAWFELFCPHEDGTSDTFSTAQPTGLDAREGCIAVHLPGADVSTLWARAQSERRPGGWSSTSTAEAPRYFEDAFARSMAWRKGRGLARHEVVRAANRRAA